MLSFFSCLFSIAGLPSVISGLPHHFRSVVYLFYVVPDSILGQSMQMLICGHGCTAYIGIYMALHEIILYFTYNVKYLGINLCGRDERNNSAENNSQ